MWIAMRSAVFLKLTFVNKGTDDINLSNILHDKRTCEKVPQYFQNRPPTVISYKYSNTVTAKILNFNDNVRNIGIDGFIKSPPSCDCVSSPFRYAPHGHVITWDFDIIPNEDLKQLLLKGPNYREQTSINWGYIIKLIFTATEDYARKWAKKESQETECFQDWVQHVKQMVRYKANNLRRTVESKRQGILDMNSLKECLKELQKKYVFVPADKAPNKILWSVSVITWR